MERGAPPPATKPMLDLLTDGSAGIDKAYPYCDIEAPEGIRIYRDVRFGKDKTPYKTSITGRS